MKRDEVPVSLFSFQDIVTTLIGIMVIVILVIALQMLQTVEEVSQASAAPEDDRYENLVDKLAAVRGEIKGLEEADSDDTQEDPLEEYRDMTATQLKAVLTSLENETMDLEELLNRLKQRQEELAAAAANNATTAEGVAQSTQESQQRAKDLGQRIQDVEASIAAIEKDIQKLRDTRDALQDAIAQKQRSLAFTFIGRRTHTPIIVECDGDVFRAAVYPLDGEVKEFDNGGFQTNLNDFCGWLSKFSPHEYYPVLLYRKNSFARSDEIEAAVKKVNSSFRLGRDPISSSVVVFK